MKNSNKNIKYIIKTWLNGKTIKRFPNPTGIQEIELKKFKKINSKFLSDSTKCCSTGTCS